MKHAYLLYTGYGKTKMCLDKIMRASRIPRVLLISTKNVVETAWREEISKWYSDKITYSFITGSVKEKDRLDIINKHTDILGINTSMLQWYVEHTCSIKSKRHYKNEIKITYKTEEILDRFDLLIIDEVSLFKNSQSARFKIVKKWAWKMQNVMLLSATPSPKNIEDFWAEMYLIDGGKRLGRTITAFRTDFGIPTPLANGHNKWSYTDKAVDEVLRRVKDIVTSIPKPAQNLFPEPIIKKIILKPDKATQKLLDSFKEDYILQLPQGKNIVAFSKNQLMIKIAQVANGSVYDKDTTYHLNNIKLRALKYLMTTINTPIMVIYNHVFNKEQLLKLPGAVLLDNSQAFKDWNENKIKLGVLSPFSAAHGLNLQYSDCQHLYWFSPIWDTEKWIQTNARVCRRGQINEVTIGVLILKGTFDDYAFNLCQDKYRQQYNNLVKLS